MSVVILRKGHPRPGEGWDDPQIRKVVRGIVKKFLKQYDGDREELLAEAALVYVKCLKTVRRVRRSLRVWLSYSVYMHLKMVQRKWARRHKDVRELREADLALPDDDSYSPLDMAAEDKPRFDLLELAARLPGDAAALVWLVLNPPATVDVHTAATLKSYLTWSGWDDGRIEAAFDRVRREL